MRCSVSVERGALRVVGAFGRRRVLALTIGFDRLVNTAYEVGLRNASRMSS
jgi:hypothetical protein